MCDLTRQAMIKHGLSGEQACANFWVLDQGGLITAARSGIKDHVKVFARAEDEEQQHDGDDLLAVVKRVKPTGVTLLHAIVPIAMHVLRSEAGIWSGQLFCTSKNGIFFHCACWQHPPPALLADLCLLEYRGRQEALQCTAAQRVLQGFFASNRDHLFSMDSYKSRTAVCAVQC